MSPQSGLSIQQLSLHSAGKCILDQVSLDLPRGKVLGVLGPNGAGKTSLMSAVAGLHHQRMTVQGEVQWGLQSLRAMPLNQRAKTLAMVTQLNSGSFALALHQVVRMGLLPHQSLLQLPAKNEAVVVERALHRVGLDNSAQQIFSTLSGGEQQRGLIARALVQQAELLLLDEPVNHLDVYYQHDILGLLKHLAREHKLTVVMSLHDLNLAAMYCDQLVLLQAGAVKAAGSVADVMQENILQSVYGLPCVVRHEPHGSRVDFCPSHVTEGWPGQ